VSFVHFSPTAPLSGQFYREAAFSLFVVVIQVRHFAIQSLSRYVVLFICCTRLFEARVPVPHLFFLVLKIGNLSLDRCLPLRRKLNFLVVGILRNSIVLEGFQLQFRVHQSCEQQRWAFASTLEKGHFFQSE
jgi:hypothetical protein